LRSGRLRRRRVGCLGWRRELRVGRGVFFLFLRCGLMEWEFGDIM
jgi:hypothetical protein